MQNRNFQKKADAARTLKRGMMVFCLATTLALSINFWQETQPVSAAPVAVMSRQDRRPDRERSTAATSNAQGFSQHSGSNSASSQSHPRLVRR